MQIAQRRIAGAEIVERRPRSLRAQRFERALDRAADSRAACARSLQAQAFRADVVLSQQMRAVFRRASAERKCRPDRLMPMNLPPSQQRRRDFEHALEHLPVDQFRRRRFLRRRRGNRPASASRAADAASATALRSRRSRRSSRRTIGWKYGTNSLRVSARRRSPSSSRSCIARLCRCSSNTREAMAAFVLGAVHGDVGVAQQFLGLAIARRRNRDADARGREDFLAAKSDRRVERVDDALRLCAGVFDVSRCRAAASRIRRRPDARPDRAVPGKSAMRPPTSLSSSSPTRWPTESLMILKRSRSRNSTAKQFGADRAWNCASAWRQAVEQEVCGSAGRSARRAAFRA